MSDLQEKYFNPVELKKPRLSKIVELRSDVGLTKTGKYGTEPVKINWNSDIRIKKNASFFKNIELTVFRLYFHNPIRMGRRMHSRRAGQRSHTDAKGGICKKTKRDYG